MSVFANVRRSRARPPDAPTLSVVVPVYNVGSYIEECIGTLLAQSFTDFEAVIVDDGSTDASVELARKLTSGDARFRFVRQRHRGLGAARNRGVRAARGKYLAFLDSDDLLPRNAYGCMISTIERTGSDLVIGNLKRDHGGRRLPLRLMRANHGVRREETTLTEMPLILADVFAVNKVFRRSFWDREGLAFPVATRYEDQPTITRALCVAKQIDVLPDTVYWWRVRDDSSSLTQRRHELADLRDRLTTKRISTNIVMGTPRHVRDTWFREVLPVDMWEYFRSVPGCSDDYWDLLREGVTSFWSDDTLPFHRTCTPVEQRYMGWLVGHDLRRELEQLLEFLGRHREVPVAVRDGQAVAAYPVLKAGLRPPQTVRVLEDHDLRWEAHVERATWQGSEVRLRGYARIRKVPTVDHETTLMADLVEVGEASTSVSTAPLDVQPNPEIWPRGLIGREKYRNTGFTCAVDLAALAALRPGVASLWRFRFERRVESITRSGGVTSLDRTHTDRGWFVFEVPAHDADPPARVRARLRMIDNNLALEMRPAKLRS